MLQLFCSLFLLFVVLQSRRSFLEASAVVDMLAAAMLTLLGYRWAWALSLVGNVILLGVGVWLFLSGVGCIGPLPGAFVVAVVVACIGLLWIGRGALQNRGFSWTRFGAMVLVIAGAVALTHAIRRAEMLEKPSNPIKAAR